MSERSESKRSITVDWRKRRPQLPNYQVRSKSSCSHSLPHYQSTLQSAESNQLPSSLPSIALRVYRLSWNHALTRMVENNKKWNKMEDLIWAPFIDCWQAKQHHPPGSDSSLRLESNFVKYSNNTSHFEVFLRVPCNWFRGEATAANHQQLQVSKTSGSASLDVAMMVSSEDCIVRA